MIAMVTLFSILQMTSQTMCLVGGEGVSAPRRNDIA